MNVTTKIFVVEKLLLTIVVQKNILVLLGKEIVIAMTNVQGILFVDQIPVGPLVVYLVIWVSYAMLFFCW